MQKKYQILTNEYINFRHPTNRKKIVKLYRIIALKNLFVVGYGHVSIHEIGGYVESDDNLSHEGNCWIAHTAKAFDKAIVVDDALLKDDSAIYESAKIIGHTIMEHHAHAYGNCIIKDSNLSDNSDVKGNAQLFNVTMRNSSVVYQDARVEKTTMYDGTMIHERANVQDCVLKDVSEIRGDADVKFSKLTGRAIVESGRHRGEAYHQFIDLQVMSGKGEL